MLGKMPFRLSWKASDMELELHYSQYPLLRKHYKHRIKSRLVLFFRAFYPQSSSERGGNLTLNQLLKNGLSKHL